MTDQASTNMHEQLQQFLGDYRRAWRENKAAQIEAHWDTTQPAPFYKAEEVDRIISSWTDLRAYWQHNESFNDAIDLQFTDLSQVASGPDRILAGARMRWNIRFSPNARNMDGSPFSWAGKAMAGSNHVIMQLVQPGDELRLTAWIEAPNAAITYLAQMYIANADPEILRS